MSSLEINNILVNAGTEIFVTDKTLLGGNQCNDESKLEISVCNIMVYLRRQTEHKYSVLGGLSIELDKENDKLDVLSYLSKFCKNFLKTI